MADGNGFDIGPPGTGSGAGSGFNSEKAEHVGHLVVFVKPVLETRTDTKGKEYEVARCDYVICTKCSRAWSDHAVSGNALVPRLLSSEHTTIPGSLALGEAKAGQNAPYLLDDPTDEEITLTNKVFAKFAIKMPSGKIVFDIDAFENPGD